MKAVARGCLEFLIVWALATVGLYFLFQSRFTPPGPLVGAIIGGFLIAASWGLLRNAWQARWQASLIRHSLAGDWPRDGAMYAAIGPAKCLLESLETPFGQHECVLFSYELSRTETVRYRGSKGTRTERQRMVYMSGVAMVPWAVQTRVGDIGVIGFPIPDQYPEHRLSIQQHASRVQKFANETQFTEIGKWEVGKMFSHAKLLLSDGEGQLREDLKFAEADSILNQPNQLKSCDLIEQFIPVNDSVCVIGKYDRSKNGLVGDWGLGGLQAIPGNAKDGLNSLYSLANMRLVGALISLLFGIGGSFGILTLRENSQELREAREAALARQALDAIEANDPVTLDMVLAQGANLEMRDEQSQSILHRLTSVELLEVFLRHGASLETIDSVGRPLLLAAIDQVNSDRVRWLIDAGADVNGLQTDWKRTPLESAIERGHEEIAGLLRDRGAQAVFVDSVNGRPITENAEAFLQILEKYSQSLNHRDRQGLQDICDEWPVDFLESAERGLYANTHPATWKLESGFENDQAASLIASGKNSRGLTEQFVVTLVRNGERWRLRRIHWDQASAFEFKLPALKNQP